jgi:hypothetical protein
MGVTFPASVLRAIAEAMLELSIVESLIEWSSDRGTVAEAPTAEAGRIKLKTRAMENRAGKSIFLFLIFFIVTSHYPSSEK